MVVLGSEMSGEMTIEAVSLKSYSPGQYCQDDVTIWMGLNGLDELTGSFEGS